MNQSLPQSTFSDKKTVQIVQACKRYCKEKSIYIYFDCFYLKPEEPQGKYLLSILKENQLLFDERYKSVDLSIDPDFKPTCFQCKVSNYNSWKLIGVVLDISTQIVQLTLPSIMCEMCFRKRFCGQKNPKYVCGIAVLPMVENTSKLLPPTQAIQPAETYVKPILPPTTIQNPVQSTIQIHPVASPAEQTNYGVGNDLEAEPTENSPQEEEEETPSMIEEETGSELQDEVCFQAQYRIGGFFRTWLPSYFVLSTYSICMYPNEKRYEKKKKEILLFDATITDSPIYSDSKQKYCVKIEPGPASEQQKPFVIALPSQEEKERYINLLLQYIAIAKECYHYDDEDEEEDSDE